MDTTVVSKKRNKTFVWGILLLSFALFTGKLSAQITVNVSNKPIKEILEIIETKSDYRFFYNEKLKGLDRIKSVYLKNNTIEKTMWILLKNTEMSYKLVKSKCVVLVEKEKKLG